MVAGIDLGTTNSAIAVIRDGKAEIIPNADGDRTTPSVVMIDGDDVIVGEEAKNNITSAPLNVCQFVKRKIGDIGWMFRPKNGRQMTSEEISARILKKVTEDAEAACDMKIDDVVITVPAYFDDARRLATKQAGEIAGLNVIGLVNEPTAAAIGYAYGSNIIDGNVMVYDLGGGTFDVTVLKLSDNMRKAEILSSAGDRNLGGFDFDNFIIGKFDDEFRNKFGFSIEEDKEASGDLKEKAEEAKISLSTRDKTSFSVTSFLKQRNNLRFEITREEFEDMIKPFVEKTGRLMKQAMSDANLSWGDIKEIFITGGSTRIPLVQAYIKEISGIEPSHALNPDEAVAIGAAYYADIIKSKNNDTLPESGKNVVVRDICNHSLGIIALDNGNDEKAFKHILKGSHLPASGKGTVFPLYDNQNEFIIDVFEGESEDPKYVEIIGKAHIDFAPRKRTDGVIVTFYYDVDGIIHVYLTDDVTKESMGEFAIDRKSNLSADRIIEIKREINPGRQQRDHREDDESESDKEISESNGRGIPTEENIDDSELPPEEQLDRMIGLESVKEEVKGIIAVQEYDKARKKELNIDYRSEGSLHLVFEGNPGTGKTTVANILYKILKERGVLSENGQFVSVGRSEIVGQYLGETARNVEKLFKKANGGLLFIDEAYSLISSDNDPFGKEAVDALVQWTEATKDNVMVVLAGYTDEMENFLDTNPGLASRFPKRQRIIFPDYSDEELLEIAKLKAGDQYYSFTGEGEIAFLNLIRHAKAERHFGNGREVRNILQDAKMNKALNLQKHGLSKSYLSLLTPEDFGVDISISVEDSASEVLAELDRMIGLNDVKYEIRSILAMIKYQKEDEERHGLNANQLSVMRNLCFVGNPGTGKTTVAKLYAKLLTSIGAIGSENVQIVSRADLVGAYQGHTAMKTRAVCEKAYNGVLFVDESYSLEDGDHDSFGKEALAELIQQMENNKDRMTVILAGYKREMEEFMNVNSGLKRRISEFVEFPDYNENELYDIFCYFAKDRNRILAEDAKRKVKETIKKMYASRDANFGNAGDIRNLFEKADRNMIVRVTGKSGTMNDDERRKITADDISL